MVFVARDTEDLQVPSNRSATLMPRNDMVGFTLFPVQFVLFQAFGVCASSSLLSQELTAIPRRYASGVFVDHSTEFADACSVDVWIYHLILLLIHFYSPYRSEGSLQSNPFPAGTDPFAQVVLWLSGM